MATRPAASSAARVRSSRRRMTEQDLLREIRRHLDAHAAGQARRLLEFARREGLILRGRHASISIRAGLRPADRPATLFVISATGHVHTYWQTHWLRPYKAVANEYFDKFARIFLPLRAVVIPRARRNVVYLPITEIHLTRVKRLVTRTVQSIRSINGRAGGALDENVAALEGGLRRRMVLHRTRESRLRDARIAFISNRDGGRLRCEVNGCGFDFNQRYGALGKDYAQVHHISPLAQRRQASQTRLEDLRVVCANCHVMIHRGGQSRSLHQIAAAIQAARRHRRSPRTQ